VCISNVARHFWKVYRQLTSGRLNRRVAATNPSPDADRGRHRHLQGSSHREQGDHKKNRQERRRHSRHLDARPEAPPGAHRQGFRHGARAGIDRRRTGRRTPDAPHIGLIVSDPGNLFFLQV